MAFAEKLRALRLENNMTQKYIAERLNVARSTIAGYETKNRQPSHEKLTAFAGLFQVTVDYLLDDGSSTCISVDRARTVPDDAQELMVRYLRLSIPSKKDLLKQLDLLEIRDGIRVQGTEQPN